MNPITLIECMKVAESREYAKAVGDCMRYPANNLDNERDVIEHLLECMEQTVKTVNMELWSPSEMQEFVILFDLTFKERLDSVLQRPEVTALMTRTAWSLARVFGDLPDTVPAWFREDYHRKEANFRYKASFD